jgi:hypothetical protein
MRLVTHVHHPSPDAKVEYAPERSGAERSVRFAFVETEAAARARDDEYHVAAADVFEELAGCQVDDRVAALCFTGCLVYGPDDPAWEFGGKAHFYRNHAIDSISNDLGHAISPSLYGCSLTPRLKTKARTAHSITRHPMSSIVSSRRDVATTRKEGV